MKILTINEFFANKSYTINADGSTDAGLSKQEKSVTPRNKKELKEMICDEIESKGVTADLNFINTSHITDMSYLFVPMDEQHKQARYNIMLRFNGDVSKWDVSNVTNMDNMFAYCTQFDADLSKWNVSKVKNMNGMFVMCNSFKGKGVEHWDVSNVETMKYMFKYCFEFCADLSKWNVKKLKYAESMFSGCTSFYGKGVDKWELDSVQDAKLIF